MQKGIFITFEGIDGAGKSSHIEPLARRIKGSGRNVCVTREPGGTPLAEGMRQMILNSNMDPMTEILTAFGARRDHLNKVIIPALARGEVVLCDRFTDSTFAYQGYGRCFGDRAMMEMISDLERRVQTIGGSFIQPDVTLWFDLDPLVAARRLQGAREPDRFESEKGEFFGRVRMGYQARQRAATDRQFCRIQADRTQDQVFEEVLESVPARLVFGSRPMPLAPLERLAA